MSDETIPLGNVSESAGAPGGYHWVQGDVVEVPYDLAVALLAIKGAGFFEVVPSEATDDADEKIAAEEAARLEEEARANSPVRQEPDQGSAFEQAMKTVAAQPRKKGGRTAQAIQKNLDQKPVAPEKAE